MALLPPLTGSAAGLATGAGDAGAGEGLATGAGDAGAGEGDSGAGDCGAAASLAGLPLLLALLPPDTLVMVTEPELPVAPAAGVQQTVVKPMHMEMQLDRPSWSVQAWSKQRASRQVVVSRANHPPCTSLP